MAVATGGSFRASPALAGDGDDKHRVLTWTETSPYDGSTCTFRAEGHLVGYAGTVAMSVPDTAAFPSCLPYSLSMTVRYRDTGGTARSVAATSDGLQTSFSRTFPDVDDQFTATVTFVMPWGEPCDCWMSFPMAVSLSRTVTPK